MDSSQLRQSFLDYFAARQHRIVTSAPLLPTSPNLLFTNAGMNQFVPYFLGEREAPFKRAADTQKCIRAGGKHNDLEDVGFDTYHHTFFEMLGNWSFGDYFKAEAIVFAWELLTGVWGFPQERLYATVYQPAAGDPAEFDQEAHDLWSDIFKKAGLDPAIHIRTGGKKDNFWMMGETGPCGPCSEIHIDLTPNGDSGGHLVNADSPWCIEVWNLVFIQFNANEDGSLSPLPARHVDTGMGFERVAGILATTRGFSDFSQAPSNYNSDLFTDIFAHLAEHCDHRYAYTMPENRAAMSELEQKDCAFRVIADHIRTLSFSVADGILPGNEGRNYVLRRILRRAVLFGQRLGLPEGFFAKIAPIVIAKMGGFFPELYRQETTIIKVLAAEESAFNKTIERGLQLFGKLAADGSISGREAFTLYDTFGFPLDLTELLAREKGISVDAAGFAACMEEQRQRGRAARQTQVIRLAEQTETAASEFVGYEAENLIACSATVVEAQVDDDGSVWVAFDRTPFYPEMGGQLGDTGMVEGPNLSFLITDTRKGAGDTILHRLDVAPGSSLNLSVETIPAELLVTLTVNTERRRAIQRHHTATHLLNWALRSTLGDHVRQAGSLVAADRLRFDFAHFEAVTPEQLQTIEEMVNEASLNNFPVVASEILYRDKPEDVVAVFGEKYGERVRVVDIGGFSKELCGGTHVAATGEVGPIKIVAETGIAAGTRRIEAVCGEAAWNLLNSRFSTIQRAAEKLGCPATDFEKRLEALITQKAEAEREVRRLQQQAAAASAGGLARSACELRQGLQGIFAAVEAATPEDLRGLALSLSSDLGEGVVALGATIGEKLSLVVLCTPKAVEHDYRAGDIMRELASRLGGKGGGKPDFAMGGAPAGADLKGALGEIGEKLTRRR